MVHSFRGSFLKVFVSSNVKRGMRKKFGTLNIQRGKSPKIFFHQIDAWNAIDKILVRKFQEFD